MAQQRKPFDKLFSQLQDIRDKDGKLLNTVLWSQKGNPSVLFEIENPVQQYCTDADLYCLFQDVLANIIKTLGEGYALQKQDIFCKQKYHHEPEGEQEFLTEGTGIYQHTHLPHRYAGVCAQCLCEIRRQTMGGLPRQSNQGS